METQLKKIHTGKDLFISGIIIAAGIGLYFWNAGLGGVIGVCGLLMLLFYKAGYKANGEGPVLTKKAMDLSHACRNSIVDYLGGKDVDPALNEAGLGASVRLEVYYNKAEGIVFAQLFDFSNYTYEPATQLVELHSPRADKLLGKL
jgi:hypothetical protein